MKASKRLAISAVTSIGVMGVLAALLITFCHFPPLTTGSGIELALMIIVFEGFSMTLDKPEELKDLLDRLENLSKCPPKPPAIKLPKE